jgi:hypothetical protein
MFLLFYLFINWEIKSNIFLVVLNKKDKVKLLE